MKTTVLLAGAAIAASAATITSASAQDSDLFDRVEAGRYKTILADCGSCHTAPGGKPFAGGAPLITPFGPMIPPNITPDRATGIGDMTYQEFRASLKEGRGMGGKRLYPAMPYPAYTMMTERDIADIWAYLRKIEPVSHAVESNQLSWPFSMRAAMIGWNWLNFSPQDFKPDPTKSAEWNRGAYLVNGPGHCGTCHTPKSATGADKTAKFLQGGALEGWVAPDITNDAHQGVGRWSTEDLLAYLKTGGNRYDTATGPMAEVVSVSTRFWNDADLNAVAAYLKDVKGAGAAAPQPIAASDATMTAGQAIYVDRCAACHVDTGEGAPALFPTLAKGPVVNSADPATLIRVVLQGSQGVATPQRPTAPAMPSFAWNLDDSAVADVLTYVRNSWGNAAPAVSAAQVRDARAALTR